MKILRTKKYLLVISDWFAKLFRSFPLQALTAECASEAFVTHWFMACDPPRFLLLDKCEQFPSRVFQHVRKNLEIESVFIDRFHPQANDQVERHNRINISALHNYVAQHSQHCDSYTDILTLGYSTQIHRITKCILFELVLSQPRKTFIMQAKHKGMPGKSRGAYLHCWKIWYSHLADSASKKMLQDQKYKVPKQVQQKKKH